MKALWFACAGVCFGAAVAVLILKPYGAPRYHLQGIEETAAATGRNVRTVYRIDTITGKTWRIESDAVMMGSQNLITWPDGWEEIPEGSDAAMAVNREKWAKKVHAQ